MYIYVLLIQCSSVKCSNFLLIYAYFVNGVKNTQVNVVPTDVG